MVIEKRGNNYRITIYCGSDSKGRPVRERVLFRPDPTLTDKQAKQAAYKYGLEIENRLKRGGSVKYENITFNKFAALYFQNHAPRLKEYTAKQYRDIYERRIKPYFGNMKLSNITALDVMQWLAALNKADNSGALTDNSKGVYFRTLKAMLGVAVRWDIIQDNPCKKVTTPRSKQTGVKALQREDVNKLFRSIDSYADARARILVYIFLLTGIRESEAAGLQWHDIDFDNQIIHIEREALYIPKQGLTITPPKSFNSIRDIYIPALLCEKLREYKNIQETDIKDRGDLFTDNGFIITQFNGAPVHASTIRKWIKAAFVFCDVPYITVHGLRHTYASLLTAAGTDPRTTAAQLGHSTPALVMNTYANPQNEAKRRAADTIESITKTPGFIQFAPNSPQNGQNHPKNNG